MVIEIQYSYTQIIHAILEDLFIRTISTLEHYYDYIGSYLRIEIDFCNFVILKNYLEILLFW